MGEDVKDIRKKMDRALREGNARRLRADVGRGYWVVKIVPWLVGAAIGLLSLSTCDPTAPWFDLVLCVLLSFAFFGAMAGQLTHAALIDLCKRTRAWKVHHDEAGSAWQSARMLPYVDPTIRFFQKKDRFARVLWAGCVPTFVWRTFFDWPDKDGASFVLDFAVAVVTSMLWPIYWWFQWQSW